jgi:N-acetylglucosaminyl-diphospho-decaprenol L-rhamnosyltransferase
VTFPPTPAAVLRIIVVTYHPGPALPALLASLDAACSAPYEVVLADNGGTPDMPGTTRLELDHNLGYGRGANAGAAGFAGPWLLVVNQDVVFEPGSIDALLDAGDRWPGAAILGPLIRDLAGEIYPSARNLPSLGRGIGHALLGWWHPDNPWTRGYRRESTAPTETTCGWLSGACMLVRTDVFEAVGGFDESYFMFFEDTDLCRRLNPNGAGCVYVPAAVVHHEQGQARAQHPTWMLREHHRSAFRYLRRRYPLLAPLLALGLGARFVVLIALRRS